MRRCWMLMFAAGCGRFGFGGHTSGDAAPFDAADSRSADAAICHTGTFGTPTLLAGIATISEENNPSLSPDELTLYFESNRPPGQGRAIWQTTRTTRSDAFGTPSLVSELDSTADDRNPEISDDGLTIYFGSTRGVGSDVYVATRADLGLPFVVQGTIPITGNPSTSNADPAVMPDERTLFFSANTLEIAFATRPDRSSPFTFQREVDEVNAPQTDGDPAITDDGLELFFDSYRNGPPAIFVATRASTSDMFSAPVELPGLLGTGTADGSPEISSDGRTLYYFINDGTQIDLYTATRDCP